MDRISGSIRPFFSYPVSYWIPDIKNLDILIPNIWPDIWQTGHFYSNLFEDLRCFNYLSNYVKQLTGIEISGIWPDIQYPAPNRYPA